MMQDSPATVQSHIMFPQAFRAFDVGTHLTTVKGYGGFVGGVPPAAVPDHPHRRFQQLAHALIPNTRSIKSSPPWRTPSVRARGALPDSRASIMVPFSRE